MRNCNSSPVVLSAVLSLPQQWATFAGLAPADRDSNAEGCTAHSAAMVVGDDAANSGIGALA